MDCKTVAKQPNKGARMAIINAITESFPLDGEKVRVKGLSYSSIELEQPTTYKGLEQLLQTNEQGVVEEAWSSFVIAVQNSGRNAQKAFIQAAIRDGRLTVVNGEVDASPLADEAKKAGDEAMAAYIAGERRRRGAAAFGLKAAKAKFFDLPAEKQAEALALLKEKGDEEAFIAFVKAA